MPPTPKGTFLKYLKLCNVKPADGGLTPLVDRRFLGGEYITCH